MDFPSFDSSTIEDWDKMSPEEQAQVEQIYSEFEKLAHLMEDWVQEFDVDMAQFDVNPMVAPLLPSSPPAEVNS
jgi:hypothetical protein